ncbi:MAG: autotransporter-associated beta strand repeat-containing protein, partial [Akkermansiaceae bacterium]|nr:autotransporter-associated beta strand repeat-containing protein [Akkermansiaceae bacterium]
SLIKDNTGKLTLTGSNNYTGATTIDGGILEAQGGSAIGDASAVTVNSGGTFEVDNNETIGRISGAGNVTLNAILTTGDATNSGFSGNISGTGGLTKQGTSTMELTGSNTYTGVTTVNAGTLRMVNSSAGDAIYAATVQQSYVVDNGATLEFSRSLVNGAEDGTKTIKKFNLSGAGTFKKAGDAELRAFSDSTINMSSGALFHVNAGIFTVGGNNNAADWSGNLSDLQVDSGATLDGTGGAIRGNALDGAGSVLINGGLTVGADNGGGTFSGVIADSTLGSTDTYNLTKEGSGTQTLSGANTYSGDTTISGGTLEISGNGSLGSGTYAGAIANSGIFKQNSTVDQTLSGVISGTGSLVKDNSGTLTLTGSNTYAGDTTVNAGTLRMVNSAAGNGIRQAPNEEGTEVIYNYNVASGATLEFEQNGDEIYNINKVNLSGGGTFKKTGSQELKSFGGVSVVAMDSGALFHVESGIFTFGANQAGNWSNNLSALQVDSGATFYGAATAIVVDALNGAGSVSIGGGLSLGVDDGSGSFSGVIGNADHGSTFSLTKQGIGSQVLSGANTYTGNTTISGGTLEISGAGSLGSGTYAGAIANSGTFKQNSTADQTLSGVISGSGSLVKDNSGTLTLSGNNTYSGGTTLNAGSGIIVIAGANAAGSGAIVQTDADSTLRFNTTGTIANDMTLYNFESLQTVTLSGDINSQDATYKIASGTNTTLSGDITGTGKLRQIGADDSNYMGSLTLTGTNDYEGDTEIDSVLNVGSSGALSEKSKLKVNNGGMVKLNNHNSRVAALEGNGTIQGSASLTAGDENDATFSGVLQDGNGSLALTKKGSGKMTLSGANTYTGNTTLDEGSLELKNKDALGTGSFSQTDSSSTLIFDTTGTVTNDLSIFSVEFLQDVILSGNIIANNATYNVAAGVTSEASGDITGTGGTTKLGLGTQVLSGNNTYTGANDVQAGTLRAGSTTAFGDNVATTVDSGAILELDGFSNSIGSLAGAGTVENANATVATLTTGADNTSTTFSGVLQDGTGGGALSLTKTGSGTQTLTANNTFSGNTTVNSGTITLTGSGRIGGGGLTVNNGGTLSVATNAFNSLGGAITVNEGG